MYILPCYCTILCTRCRVTNFENSLKVSFVSFDTALTEFGKNKRWNWYAKMHVAIISKWFFTYLLRYDPNSGSTRHKWLIRSKIGSISVECWQHRAMGCIVCVAIKNIQTFVGVDNNREIRTPIMTKDNDNGNDNDTTLSLVFYRSRYIPLL